MKKESSKLLLPDVNVLLPLAWPNHQFHAHATAYLEKWKGRWATCAITQLGFIRLSSNPAVVGTRVSPGDASRLLAALTDDPMHLYLEALPAPTADALGRPFDKVFGHGLTTDAYLIALAERLNAEFATFDTRLNRLSPRVKVLGPSLIQ